MTELHIDDQAQGLRRRLRPAAADPARAIAVLSGKGGVGKTFVSTSLAVFAARRGERVVVIDGDLGLANVDVVLRAPSPFTLADVIAGRCSLDDAIAVGAHGVSVVTVGSGVMAAARLPTGERRALKDQVDELRARFDIAIIDCAAGIGDSVLTLAGLGSQRLLVLTPEPTSMVDAYATVKALADGGHHDVDIVVNCAASDVDAQDTFDRLAAVVARFLPSRVTYAGGVPRDDVVRRAVMARRPVIDEEPSSRAARGLARLGERVFLASLAARAVQGSR